MSLPPAARRRQQSLARWARRTPGYRLALEEVLPRVRSNAVLSDLAWRVFAPRHGAGQVDVPLHAGRHVAGADVSRLPVVGIVATDLGEAQALALIDAVADLQAELASFRPLFVLDQPVFAAARAHGYVLELVVPRAAFATGAHGDPQGWEGYLARRLGSLIDHYQLWHLARADGAGLDPLDEQLLRALGARLPEDLDARPRTQED